MRKFECDRCHAQQELKKDGHSSAHIKIEPHRGMGTWKHVNAELCRDCASAVWDFIMAGANPGESRFVAQPEDITAGELPESVREAIADWRTRTRIPEGPSID